MAFSNIDALANGSLLQILFSAGVRQQISIDFRDFEMIKRAKVGSSLARELRFDFQSSLGVAGIQYRNPGTTNRAYPLSQQVATAEYTAKFKEINATLELEQNLWYRAMKSPEKYGNPLEIEMDSKASGCKRRLAADLYGDGTGVVGTLPASSASVTSPASNQLLFQLSTTDAARGHVGFFEYQDILVLKSAAGGASAIDTSLATEPVYWKVIDKDFDNQRVTLQGLDSAFAPVATITSITTQPTAGEVFYRFGQPTFPNLGSISDYGTATEVIAGLESLCSADGRVIHGITMSGANAASQIDCAANPLDVKYVQKAMDKTKRNVGADRYKWKMMNMSPESHASLIESRETDRRFQTVEDNKRGVKFFAYVHANDTIECNGSEYCPPKRIYILPEAKSSEKVIEYHGSDFDPVRTPGGDAWHLKPGADGGHVNMMISYLQSVGVLVCKHPASVAVIRNFTNS